MKKANAWVILGVILKTMVTRKTKMVTSKLEN
jgi:hypothetical protein